MSLHHPAQNQLLAALPADELERLRPGLDVVPMPSGRLVHDQRLAQRHVYFPTGCIIALLHPAAGGTPARSALVGREGLVGIAPVMRDDIPAGQAVVQSSGYAYRLPVAALHAEFRRGGRLGDLAFMFAQALTVQLTQAAACSRRHALGQRICRWLLSSADRLRRPRLAVGLGIMLRVLDAPQERVLHELAVLQLRGLVRFERGAIEILDRRGLEAAACACYGVMARACARLPAAAAGAAPAARRDVAPAYPMLAEAS